MSFGVSGTKLRKHASVIPALKQQGIEEVVVIGGAHSNNVLSAAQTLKENNVKITPFLLGPPSEKLGNSKLLSLFVDDSEIHWISRSQWADREHLANCYAEKRKADGIKIFVLPEGAHHPLALPGSLSILVDILRNERESGVRFDHIFIDAGTGMVAQSLLAGAAALGRKIKFHVVVWQAHLRIFNRDYPASCNTPGSFLMFLLVHYPTIPCIILRPQSHLAAPTRLFSRK